jgi:NADH-quinone oxidoreductase subunit M
VVHYQHSPGNVLTFSIPELTSGLAALDWSEWKSAAAWGSPQVLIFLLLLAGFAIKVPLFPFHTWLPLAHVEAPTAGSILLAGVLLKVGTYGLVRFNLGMTPLASASMFPLLATMSVIGIIYGALAALAQTDIKRLVAYSSVSHMGFIVLGIFALNSTALHGSSIQMLNHGLTTGALFACVGMIYERYHTRDINAIGGLWNRMPILALFLMLATFGSAAVPGLNGFVGEFPILIGAFERSGRAGVLAATGMVLGACYLFWMLRKILFGPLKEPVPHASSGETISPAALRHTVVSPVGAHEIAGLAPVMFLIVAIGVYPRPILEQMRPTLAKIDQNAQARRAGVVADLPPGKMIPVAMSAPRKWGGETRLSTTGDGAANDVETRKGGGSSPVKKTDSNSSRGQAVPSTKDQETHS